MKKLILSIVLAFIIQATVFSQGCLPEGIVFATQSEIDNFQTNYPGCTEIEGDVEIFYYNINNLDGLSVLTAIGGGLEIVATNITSLTGLHNITTIGGNLLIWQNDLLTSFTNFENLISIGGSLEVKNNSLILNLNGLENTSIEGGIIIRNNNAIISLAALENLTSVGGVLFINANNALPNLSGLNNVASIEGVLHISYNPSLTNLSGLENVSYAGGGLGISHNSSLDKLSGLENLTSIGEYLAIDGNNSLSNLNGIQNLTSIGGFLVLDDNSTLSDITGLESIVPESITDLYIINNPNLSTCEVQSICDYIANPNGIIDIHDNAPGCNSPEEVELACLTGTDEFVEIENDIRIFPNPAKKTISIISPSQHRIKQIKIFNQTGILTIEEKSPVNKIDVSELQPGLYFVEIRTDREIFRKKLIIE